MDQRQRLAIESLLDKFGNRAEILKRMTERNQRRAEQARKEFENIRELIIRPVMTEYGELLASRGHKFRIDELNFEDEDHNPKLGIEFGMWFNNSCVGAMKESPHVGFTLSGELIRVYSDEELTAGSAPLQEHTIPMKGLKREHIETRIAEVITRVLRKWL